MAPEEHKNKGLLRRFKNSKIKLTPPFVSSLFRASKTDKKNNHNISTPEILGNKPTRDKMAYLHSGIYTRRQDTRENIEADYFKPSLIEAITASKPKSKNGKKLDYNILANSAFYHIGGSGSKKKIEDNLKEKKTLYKNFSDSFSGGAKTAKTDNDKDISVMASIGSGKIQIDEDKIPKAIRNVDMWEKQFMQMNLPGVPLQKARRNSMSKKEILNMQKEFKRARRDFLKFVAYNLREQLVTLGLLPFEIEQMQRGRSPENFNVHIKIPFEYGGTLDFSNLIVMPTHPYLDEIYKFIDMQLLHYPVGAPATVLYIPTPKGKVFHIRGGTIIGGDGGQALGDRSVFAGWTNETKLEVSIMGLGGRSPGSIR